MGVLRQRDALGRIVQEAREPAPHLVRLLECLLPYVVHQLRCIQPRLLLSFEGNIGPSLVRMTGKKNPFSDAEASVVFGELLWIDHPFAAPRRRFSSPPSAGVTT